MKRKDYISWDEYFMGVAMLSGMRSKDPNTQVGACIVSPDHKILSMGYNGLVETKKSRPQKNPCMKKANYNNPRKIEESEYEELIRLRAENEYIKAEIEVIKKEIALREEKEAALLKAKKQQLSKSSAKKDTN